jgi:hypothetical protein
MPKKKKVKQADPIEVRRKQDALALAYLIYDIWKDKRAQSKQNTKNK